MAHRVTITVASKIILILLLFYARATAFRLYNGDDMMHKMRRRKSKPTLFSTRGIFKHSMRETGLWWCCKLWIVQKWIAVQFNVMAVRGFIPLSPRSPTQCLTNWAISPPLASKNIFQCRKIDICLKWSESSKGTAVQTFCRFVSLLAPTMCACWFKSFAGPSIARTMVEWLVAATLVECGNFR